MAATTTKFIGDIQFKVGDSTRKASQLLTLSDLDGYVQTGHLFNEVDGIPEFNIKNNNIQYESFESSTTQYHILKFVNIPEDFMNKVKEITAQTNLFKVVLRKNIIYDTNGNLVKEFFIYAKDGQVYSPMITKSANGCSINNSTNMGYINIAFDSGLDFNPYTLWMNGELSIMNEYITDSLQTLKTVKCSIIKADNALKLHKSDVLYLYKPTLTSEVQMDDKKYWLLQWNIDDNYNIPTGLEFKFNEYCFGNKWFLTWNGTKWVGDNIQGNINGKMKNALNKENLSRWLSGSWAVVER
ncbi:hypothetical protein, partial [Bacteroides acidifaciens]|uniref:hypothetical protein n=1 Tax=Bacteroides acidifaciens TaxID=85831 RepID=UPI0025A676C0